VPLQSLLQRVLSPDIFRSLQLHLRIGDEIPFDTLQEQLTAMGYQRRPVAADKGHFAVRGGIIDIFPVTLPDPCRIEFWGDEIHSIRRYDPGSQKSLGQLQELILTAGDEHELLTRLASATLFDYVKDPILIWDNPAQLEDKYVAIREMGGRHLLDLKELMDQVQCQTLFFSDVALHELGGEDGVLPFYHHTFKVSPWHHPFQEIGDYLHATDPEAALETPLLELLARHRTEFSHLLFVAQSEAEERHLRRDLEAAGLEQPTIERSSLSTSLVIGDNGMAMVPMSTLTRRHVLRRQTMRVVHHVGAVEPFDLEVGQTVVHAQQGIGRYLGIERRVNHLGVDTEFLALEYADGAKFYVPLSQANMVTSYVGADERRPTLHTLGGNRWQKLRERTEEAIAGYASGLLNLYAERTLAPGFVFPSDGEEMRHFEESFPYQATADQLAAIQSVKSDMMSEKPMDRLVCGDVGYGKTEVAMRAAFKAVADGKKQVAVLVPTTVLAMQHYETFRERMADFSIRIGILSRIQGTRETRKTLKALADGELDIIIGTHRMISSDVEFKDLGLLIIDEEQRFGVRAKEHLRSLAKGVDCLHLSATPIPRTLYFALMGARDISTINTPPHDRLPVRTVIAEIDEQMMKNALQRELSREGQVFVIHNRVESIDRFAARIQQMAPQARILVGHGQMEAEELDTVFHRFRQREADILVATTIVENGLDIPNANTIFVDRADMYGLADLYQLRGRVGRWNRQAYAYFFLPRGSALSPIAAKRLSALRDAPGYGGGMRVALRDLEIRGAGDLLGTEQSGHAATIGFHLYCKLLRRAVEQLRRGGTTDLVETKMEFPFDARLPEDYVNDLSLRLEIYHRWGEAIDLETVDAIYEELQDRFGKPPLPVQWLYHLTRLRVYASAHRMTLLKIEPVAVTGRLGTHPAQKALLYSKPQGPEEMEKAVLAALRKLFHFAD
jgi:transcription-repair coupling factor (superfamily II helicase)